MNIPNFLNLATELETEISRLYEQIADASGDPPIGARLKSIANEEINHANTIRSGLKYFEGLPDLFAGATMDESELRTGLEEIRRFRRSLASGKVRLLDNLQKLLEFEKRYERVHIGASMKITDPGLKQLFAGLAKGDQSHIENLKILIESLGGGA